ncbi:MAG: pectinesterase family protein [Bacteroides sp.]|nr:pectinesterase family protein [Bacteroides sp.]
MKTIRITPKDKLSEALKKAEPFTRIILERGVYREKTEIGVPNITLIGSGRDETVIVYDDYAKKLDESGREYNTFRTYTMAVTAPNVTLEALTVENDSRFPEKKGQEVALTVYADGFSASDCGFVSTQDTVFCGPLPPDLTERYNGFLKDELRRSEYEKQIFKNCFIAGTVDFIFGCGDALFENCEIKSLFDVRGHGYAAAPAHALSQSTGFVFDRCRFTCDERVESGSVFLARPWRDHGKASFISCRYGRHIAEAGFDKWNDTERDKTARFAEYNEHNAKSEGRVKWSKIISENEKETLLSYFKET